MARRPLLTFNEAAEAAGVSRDTIKRRHRAGAFPGAERDDRGAWRVPTAELIAAGFTLHAPGAGEPERVQAVPDLDELAQLRAELARVTAERDQWRAVAEERLRTVEVATLAMRAIGPAPGEPQGAAPARRRWFR